MLLGQIFAKNAKNDSKTLFEASNRSKHKIRKITVKSRNDVKSACFFHVLCYISAIFEDIDLKFCTHIHETLSSNIGMLRFFQNFNLGRNSFEKKLIFFYFSRNFEKKIKLRDSSFVALLILRQFISQLIVALKLHQRRRFP